MPKRANARDIKLTPYDKLFESTDPANQNAQDSGKLALSELHPFINHPFKLYSDEKMQEMVDSVRQNGVLMPILVRPENDGNGYEIISGHNRVEAAKRAGLSEIPATIREMDDETAVIAMVDSNLRQREKLLPSEKARAYKMKLEAMNRQGTRSDLTCVQVEHKLDNKKSRQIIAEQVGESSVQITRFIRLTELTPALLDMVDEGRMAFNPAVAVSYLSEEQQNQLKEIMDRSECTPSLSQADRLKEMAQENRLSLSVMEIIMNEPKPQQNQITFKYDRLARFFPRDFTPQQMEDHIIKLLEIWYRRRQQENGLSR